MYRNNEEASYIKRLYQEKFFTKLQQGNLIDKVINFQKKIHLFNKNKTISTQRQYAKYSNKPELIEQTQLKRPHTNYTSRFSSTKKPYLQNSLGANQKIKTQSQSVKLLVNGPDKNQYSFLTQNLRTKINHHQLSYKDQTNNKQVKQFQRGFTHEQKRNQRLSEIQLTKDQIRQYFRSYNISRKQAIHKKQEKKVRAGVAYRQATASDLKRQRAQDNYKERQILMIDKLHFHNKKSLDTQRMKQILQMRNSKRSHYKSSLSKDHQATNFIKRSDFGTTKNIKKQVKIKKQLNISQDKILNLQLNPWNTRQIQYV